MQQESHRPNYGPTEYDFDFNVDLDFSFSDYLMIGTYYIFVLPILALFDLAHYPFNRKRDAIAQTREAKAEQLRTPHPLSFTSKTL